MNSIKTNEQKNQDLNIVNQKVDKAITKLNKFIINNNHSQINSNLRTSVDKTNTERTEVALRKNSKDSLAMSLDLLRTSSPFFG